MKKDKWRFDDDNDSDNDDDNNIQHCRDLKAKDSTVCMK